MDFDSESLINFQPIIGVTINTVLLSPLFRTVLYSLIGVILTFATIVFLARNKFSAAVRKAVVVTLFVSGLCYAVQGDIVWSSWLIADSSKYGGLTTDEKLSRMEGAVYDFIRSARSQLRGDYVLFCPDAYLSTRTEYFLLPLRRREQADYVIVLADKGAVYDPVSHTLTRGDRKIDRLDPVLVFARDAYVLRRQP